MTMTAEEQTEGQQTIPMEGGDITPKKDGGVFKVTLSDCVLILHINPGCLLFTHADRLT